MLSNTGFETIASDVLEAAKTRHVSLATAESCTGGLIMAALTDIAGSSAVIDRAFVTYTNKAKMQMLGVEAATLRAHGAVSEQTAIQMATGALARASAHLVVSVTGIAGPGGGTAEKPVGSVCFGLAYKFPDTADITAFAKTVKFKDEGRAYVRRETTIHALGMMLEALAQ